MRVRICWNASFSRRHPTPSTPSDSGANPVSARVSKSLHISVESPDSGSPSRISVAHVRQFQRTHPSSPSLALQTGPLSSVTVATQSRRTRELESIQYKARLPTDVSSRWHNARITGTSPGLIERSFLPCSHALQPYDRTKGGGHASSLKPMFAPESGEVWERPPTPCVMVPPSPLRRRSRPPETRRGATTRHFGLDSSRCSVHAASRSRACADPASPLP